MPVPDWPHGTLPHHWPHCPTCGRWVHPDLWPGHVGRHDTPADPPPTEDDMNEAWDAELAYRIMPANDHGRTDK